MVSMLKCYSSHSCVGTRKRSEKMILYFLFACDDKIHGYT